MIKFKDCKNETHEFMSFLVLEEFNWFFLKAVRIKWLFER